MKKSCILCDISNCLRCDQDNICENCAEVNGIKHTLNTEKTSCLECNIANCLSCQNEKNKCDSCSNNAQNKKMTPNLGKT